MKDVLISQEQIIKLFSLLSKYSDKEKMEILKKAEVYAKNRKSIYIRDIERAIEK